jgi:hypothetical protein
MKFIFTNQLTHNLNNFFNAFNFMVKNMSLSHNNGKNVFERWNTRHRSSFNTFQIIPISPSLGAEIVDLDLSQPLSTDTINEIKTAIAENLVLVFRNQHITAEHHKQFANYFGTLHQHKLTGNYTDENEKSDPEILAWINWP